MEKVTIIVPVYSDWPSLRDCIISLQKHVDERHRVLFVNDCGPEADTIEKNIKKSIRGYKNYFYYRNDKNLGFVKSCNHAVFDLDGTQNDILLLNSDTKVTEGFLEELIEVLYSSSGSIGAVSPRSNNATIATIPIDSMKTKGINPERSYEFFAQYRLRLPKFTVAPVAHGFCMLVKRKLIEEYGLFDEIFGKGYGEEVDFCLRIRTHGYSSAISNWSYVFHIEGRSFGLDKKNALIRESSKIITQRYPTYRQDVTNYINKALIQEEFSLLKRLRRIVLRLINSLKIKV